MKIKKIKLLDYGIFQKPVNNVFEEDDISSPTGYLIHTDTAKVIQSTDKILIENGVLFGIAYKISVEPSIEVFNFECKIIHPPITNPETNITYTETKETKLHYPNYKYSDFYEFEFDWEMKPGIWKFQVIQDNKILMEKAFELF